MVIVILDELTAHLGSHQAMGQLMFLDEFVEALQIKAHFFIDDIKGAAIGQGAIEVKHVRVETKGGIGEPARRFLNGIITALPLHIGGKVVVL